MPATDPANILIELQARGVQFTVADEKLRWTPRDVVRSDEVELLRRFKPDLIRLLVPGAEQLSVPDQAAVSTITPPSAEPWSAWLCRSLTARTGQTWYATTPHVLRDDDHRSR